MISNQEMPDRNSSAAQVASISDGLPDVGLQQQAADDRRHDQRRDECGQARPCSCMRFGEQPRADHRKGRFDEFGRLDGIAGER